MPERRSASGSRPPACARTSRASRGAGGSRGRSRRRTQHNTALPFHGRTRGVQYPPMTTRNPVTTEEEWRKVLTAEQVHVLREHGTERPGSSPLNIEKRNGTFVCAGCGAPLFSSDTKFESGTGWPSFWAPLEGALETSTDDSFFMRRIEVHCARCGG